MQVDQRAPLPVISCLTTPRNRKSDDRSRYLTPTHVPSISCPPVPKTAIRCVSHTRRRALSVIGRRVRQAMDCSERRSPNFTPPCQAHNKLSEHGSARTCTLFNVAGYVKRAPVFWTAEREMWGHGLRFVGWAWRRGSVDGFVPAHTST